MAEGERDSTQDWLVPAERRPATMFELEQRVDVALAIAKGAEAAALEIGEAAIDAARQANRAAELAERAVGAGAADRAAPTADVSLSSRMPRETRHTNGSGAENRIEDERLRLFTERADRVVARLRSLERAPQLG